MFLVAPGISFAAAALLPDYTLATSLRIATGLKV